MNPFNRLILLVLLVLLSCQRETNAQEKALSDERREELKIKIKALVQELDAETLGARDQAEKNLLALGPDIVSLLPKITPATPAEVEIRLRRLTEKLQAQGVEVSIAASTVRLQGKMAIADALKKLTEQTGNQFRFEALPQREIELNLDGVSFWEATDEILDLSGLDIEPFSDALHALRLRPKQPNAGMRFARAVYAGVFRLEATQLTATRSLTSPDQDSLKIQAWIAWEPRLKPVYIQFPMKNVVAELSDGSTLQATLPDESPEFSPQGNSSQVEVEFTIQLPSRSVKEIKGLKGTFNAALPGKQVQIEFDQLDKPGRKSQKNANLQVAVERIRKNNSLYEIVTLIKLENAQQSMDSFRGWVLNNEAYLLDDANKRVENVGTVTYRMGGNEVGLSFLFDMAKGADKYRFVYDAPGAIREQEFSFQFAEMPLP